MTDTRRDIARYVNRHPGVHFSGLVDALELAPGQVQYHLRRLGRDGRVVAEPRYGRTHYFDPEVEPWERRAIAVLRRETAADVVALVLAEGPTRPTDVAEEIGIARSTLEWHLDRLVEEGLVEKRRPDGNRVVLSVPEPRTAARLLDTVDASIPGRLVDRFARLVDDLLEGPPPEE
ncbi:MAG: winged helix-turn-helix transcriptional regulator [Halobacteriales archaeon]